MTIKSAICQLLMIPISGRSIKKNFGMDTEETSNIPMKSMVSSSHSYEIHGNLIPYKIPLKSMVRSSHAKFLWNPW